MTASAPTRRTILQACALSGIGLLATACGSPVSDDTNPPSDAIVGTGGEARLDVERAALATDHTATGELVAAFAGALLPHVPGAAATNLVYSPWSIISALAMNRAGADGSTRSQIDAALKAPTSGTQPVLDELLNTGSVLLEQRNRTITRDQDTAHVVLRSANETWGQRGVAWERPFLRTLSRFYGSGVRLVDFRADPDAARRAINAWVADQTEQHITDLVPAGAIDIDTRLALVNALYFSAPWEEPFAKELTRPGDFTRADGSRVTTQLMRGLIRAASAVETDRHQAVRLPFAGGQLALTAILPRPGRERDVATWLAGTGVAEVVAAPGHPGVHLTMPRFRFRSTIDLEPVLKALGITDAFDPNAADYSSMTRQEKLFITAALHQATIRVDESGAEAAAATAILMGVTSAPAVSAEVVLDRPFWVVVHDVETRIPLFVGHVTDPSATS